MADSRLLYAPRLLPEAALKGRGPPPTERNESPWIEYVAGQWVVLKRRRAASAERRSLHAMRRHIDTLLEQGWSITGRDPVRLERQHQVKIVWEGVLIDC